MIDHPFWGRGFRPFFFLGALLAAMAMPLWVFLQQGAVPNVTHPAFWHAHEMVFGFTVAIISGFLLTAVANWTGGAPARHYHLAVLSGLWFLGRLAMLSSELSPILLYIAELSYLPALILSLAVPLWRSRHVKNYLFIGLLSALWVCDLMSIIGQSLHAIHVAILWVMVIISVIGGRVIPSFTVAALRRTGVDAVQYSQPGADMAAIALGFLTVFAFIFFGDESLITGICALLVSLVNLLRLYRFKFFQSYFDPMVWILHIGFLWMILGFFFLFLSSLNFVSFSVALHALTAGGIGTLCIGMMCRVALGHTGRAIKADFMTVMAFFLMQVSALIRVFGVLIWPEHHAGWVTVSGLLWALVFGIYAVFYARTLFTPRPDGAAV